MPAASARPGACMKATADRRLRGRNKRISQRFLDYSADARSTEVSAGQPDACVRGILEQLDPTGPRNGLVVVIGPGQLGTGKLCSRNVNQIAAKQDIVLAGAEEITHMARGMPRYRQRQQMIGQ